MSLQFVDHGPPGARKIVYDHEAIAAELRKRPGKWAVLPIKGTETNVRSVAHHITRGKYAPYQDGKYEAVSRRENSKVVVYARYLPGRKRRAT